MGKLEYEKWTEKRIGCLACRSFVFRYICCLTIFIQIVFRIQQQYITNTRQIISNIEVKFTWDLFSFFSFSLSKRQKYQLPSSYKMINALNPNWWHSFDLVEPWVWIYFEYLMFKCVVTHSNRSISKLMGQKVEWKPITFEYLIQVFMFHWKKIATNIQSNLNSITIHAIYMKGVLIYLYNHMRKKICAHMFFA